MQLAENIRDYYLAHLTELPEEKQFHLCTRLAAWEGHEQALKHLAELRPLYVPEPCTKEALTHTLRNIIDNPPAMPTNAAQVRDPYFAQYPWLRGLELALFRIRHLRAVYGVDARPALFDIVSRKQLLAYEAQLWDNPEAMRMLSTYAINYIYLLERQIVEHDVTAIPTHRLQTLHSGYNLDDPVQMQLCIYLYTHCIIADSDFYTLPIPAAVMPDYHKMLATLEASMQDKLPALSLDTKLEFLVCARICHYDTALADVIYDECERSLSPEGTFVIDTHNRFAGRQQKATFKASEHRNVLLIMSTTPYHPHDIRVS